MSWLRYLRRERWDAETVSEGFAPVRATVP
jgi:hypothetical protein